MSLRRALAVLFLAAFALPVFAQRGTQPPAPTPAADDAKAADKEKDKKSDEKPAKEEKPVVTQHEASIGGAAPLHGDRRLHADEGRGRQAQGEHLLRRLHEGRRQASRRPITFTFNGGPGSSSVWLHLGAIGPRRVVMGDDGEPLPPPYRLVDNEYSWLAFTDLVFIDPVTTGYSRPAVGREAGAVPRRRRRTSSRSASSSASTRRGTRAGPRRSSWRERATARRGPRASPGYLQDRFGMYLNGIVAHLDDPQFPDDRLQRRQRPARTSCSCRATPRRPGTTSGCRRTCSRGRSRRPSRESEKFALGEYDLALMRGLGAARRRARRRSPRSSRG